MTDQRTLLSDYATRGSEAAFRELVERYVDLVYSTALRLVEGDTHRAEDVTQMVFADLARLSGSLSRDVMLGGWLHRRACHVAATLMRSERRRRDRERQAVEMSSADDRDPFMFDLIAPVLDEAINQLNAGDRAAIILRFFERRDLRAVGEALGSNEDAAQKRVSRAVEKLRLHFARRGLTVSSTVIASAVATHAVHAAPATLASAVLANPLLPAAGAGTSGLTSALTKFMLMKKTTFIVVGVLLLGAAVSVPLLRSKDTPASRPVTEKSLLEGLVLHYNFDLPEADGKVTDESKLGNNGRATGVRWAANGKMNGAYEFTADGNEIVVPDNPSLNPGQLTLAAWVKTSNADRIWRRIFDKSYSQGYALSIAGDWQKNQWRGLASMEIGPGTHFILTKTRVTDGQWHQVVTTFDGTEEVLYVDGKAQSRLHWEKPGAVGTTSFNLVIGCNRSNLTEEDLGTSFRGLIDEPMMWNRALSEAEVAFLFDSQNGSPSAEAAAN